MNARLYLWSLAMGCGALAACSSAIKVPDQVSVRVPVPCIAPEKVPARPQLRSESDLMAMDRYRRTLAVWSEWLKLQVYASELEAIAQGCSRLKESGPPGP